MLKPEILGQKQQNFPDKRLDKRNQIILDKLTDMPHTSLSESLGDNGSDRCYDFWSNSLVDPDAILAQIKSDTYEIAKNLNVILIIQDTSEISSAPRKRQEESQFSDSVFLHTSLAIRTDGLPIGIVDQLQWRRLKSEYGKKHKRKEKPIEDKESSKWLHPLNSIRNHLPKAQTKILISDRESDVYDYFSALRSNEKLLIRIAQDRALNDATRIKKKIDLEPSCGYYDFSIHRTAVREERIAKMEIRYRQVEILPPISRIKERLQNFPAVIIKVSEINAPDGEEPIVWYLLTTLPVNCIADVLECVRLYTLRWLIERFHYILKSGCQIEKLQLASEHSIANSIATYSIVAYRLMHMLYLSRIAPKADCLTIITPNEFEAIYFMRNPSASKLPDKRPTVEEVVVWIAVLGGYRVRKNSPPGLKTLWLGLVHLIDYTSGYIMAKARFSNCQSTSS